MGIKSLKHVEPYRLIKMKRLNQTPSVYLSSLMVKFLTLCIILNNS